MAYGGQTKDQLPDTDAIVEHGGKFIDAVGALADKFYRPVKEGVLLTGSVLKYAGDYARYVVDHTDARAIPWEEGVKREQNQADEAHKKADAEQAEREHLLQGDHPASASEVQDWMNGPYAGELPEIPNDMGSSGHVPEIIIEEIPGGGLY